MNPLLVLFALAGRCSSVLMGPFEDEMRKTCFDIVTIWLALVSSVGDLVACGSWSSFFYAVRLSIVVVSGLVVVPSDFSISEKIERRCA